jgi:hypothetical protein
MARRLGPREIDIFCAERPDMCTPFGGAKLYNDGVVTQSVGLGFPVMVFVKKDGDIIYLEVSKEFPGGVRQDIPAPPGFIDEALARIAKLFEAVKITFFVMVGVFVLYVIWDSGILKRLSGARAE